MKSVQGVIGLVLGGLMLLPGCWQSKKEEPVLRTGLVVVNVLDKDAYNDCHILGSINIPFENLESSMNTIDKNAEVVFYCSNPMCTASEYAAVQFQKAGFSNVSVFEGGTAEWFQKGLPVEGVACAPYLRQPVSHVACEQHPCKVLTVEELASKIGFEVATSVSAPEVGLGEQCMGDLVAS